MSGGWCRWEDPPFESDVDDLHSGLLRGLDSRVAVLEDEARRWIDREARRREQERRRIGLMFLGVLGGDDGAEERRGADELEGPLHGPADPARDDGHRLPAREVPGQREVRL